MFSGIACIPDLSPGAAQQRSPCSAVHHETKLEGNDTSYAVHADR